MFKAYFFSCVVFYDFCFLRKITKNIPDSFIWCLICNFLRAGVCLSMSNGSRRFKWVFIFGVPLAGISLSLHVTLRICII